MQNFDPFIDWEAIDDEIAADLNKAVKNYRRAQLGFAKMKRGDEDFAKAADRVGMVLEEARAMPANNLMLLLRRAAPR